MSGSLFRAGKQHDLITILLPRDLPCIGKALRSESLFPVSFIRHHILYQSVGLLIMRKIRDYNAYAGGNDFSILFSDYDMMIFIR